MLIRKDSPNQWDSRYDDYLHDESRRIGTASSISFPRSEDEVAAVVREAHMRAECITVQGARTGIVAGAVPLDGCILSLSRMKSVGGIKLDERTGEWGMTVQPGVLLSEVREAATAKGLFFPPDPTESSASIGGMAATNASGALTFAYGPMRCWIDSLRLVLSDGSLIALRRGENYARGRLFEMATEDGRVIEGQLPTYQMPSVKSAAGYYVTDDMDMIDLFIGMEGTLGVITEIGLRLIPRPPAINGLVLFMPSEDAAIALVRAIRGQSFIGLHPVAIEFFNSNSLDLLRRMRLSTTAFSNIPALKPYYHTAIYVEFHGDSEDSVESDAMKAMELAVDLGGSDEDTWYGDDHVVLQSLKDFRHAIPEAVNLLIGERKLTYPDLVKLGTDMSVPDACLESIFSMYNTGLREYRLESVIFGHIGNNHLHVNILPRNMEEYARGSSLYMKWAGQIVSNGGSVSAEHGIGKLKTSFLELMYGADSITEMRALKSLFDPDMLLNSGTLFAL